MLTPFILIFFLFNNSSSLFPSNLSKEVILRAGMEGLGISGAIANKVFRGELGLSSNFLFNYVFALAGLNLPTILSPGIYLKSHLGFYYLWDWFRSYYAFEPGLSIVYNKKIWKFRKIGLEVFLYPYLCDIKIKQKREDLGALGRGWIFQSPIPVFNFFLCP